MHTFLYSASCTESLWIAGHCIIAKIIIRELLVNKSHNKLMLHDLFSLLHTFLRNGQVAKFAFYYRLFALCCEKGCLKTVKLFQLAPQSRQLRAVIENEAKLWKRCRQHNWKKIVWYLRTEYENNLCLLSRNRINRNSL